MNHINETKEFYSGFADRYDEFNDVSAEYYHIAVDYALIGREDVASPNILDLGTGTGQLPRLFLERKPEATITGIDVSQDMLSKAEKNLRAAGANDIRLICGAIPGSIPEESYDIIVSANALCFDTIPFDDLFLTIYERLNPGGIFVYIVEVLYNTEVSHNKALQLRRMYDPQLSDEQRSFIQSIGRDIGVRYYPIDWHLQKLTDNGFCNVDCIYKKHTTAIFCAEKA